MKVKVVTKILEANERIADENRKLFTRHNIFVVNLMSSPGAGKTTVLEKSVDLLKGKGVKVGIIEGDIAGTADAERLSRHEVAVVQINTGGACHLDANMISEVLKELPLEEIDLLFVENVGNLVCPAEFRVGEDAKVMILSITEGDDKPLKYPLMFQESSVLLLNKMDIAEYLDVDIEKIKNDVKSLNRNIEIFECSAKKGTGLDPWIAWIMDRAGRAKVLR
jgi:hydrogenase nickel incorporation protein HypB